MFNVKLFLLILIINVTLIKCNSEQIQNKYVKYIFNKYGNKGIITFEGLENLMHDLGLGGVEFIPKHMTDDKLDLPIENYEKIHFNSIDQISLNKNNNNNNNNESQGNNDKEHSEIFDLKHIKNTEHEQSSINDMKSNCLSPLSLMNLIFGKNNSVSKMEKINYEFRPSINQKRHLNNILEDRNSFYNITPEILLDICPALLVQIEERSCVNSTVTLIKKSTEMFEHAWAFASIAILIISLCGLSGVAIIPLTQSLAYQEILRFLIALAIGTLAGDALMHLLPHALAPHDQNSLIDDHSNDSVWICACAFVSANFMYIIEKSVPLIFGTKHNHSHEKPMVFKNVSLSKKNSVILEEDVEINMINDLHNNENTEINEMIEHNKKQSIFKLSPVALMVIIGDGLHNITDGLAIGAAFALDPITGMSTAMAVLCHELPHELGDFALLLQSGISIQVAFCYNILSSILSFIGMVCGLIIVENHNSFVRWIYSATAGSFLYIAFADLIPELGHSSNSFKHLIIQVSGMALGGLVMLLIGLNEDRIRVLFE